MYQVTFYHGPFLASVKVEKAEQVVALLHSWHEGTEPEVHQFKFTVKTGERAYEHPTEITPEQAAKLVPDTAALHRLFGLH